MFRSILLALLLLPGVAEAGRPLVGFSGRDGIELSVSSLFDELPPAGYAPIVVAIENGTSSKHRWEIRARASRGWSAKDVFASTWSVEVEAGARREVELLAPLPPPSDRSGNMQLEVEIDGFGVDGDRSRLNSAIPAPYDKKKPYVGLAATLEAKDPDRFLGKSSPIRPVRFLAETAPTDWRAYLGLDAIWLAPEDVDKLSEGARSAILDWVRQGGRLFVCSKETLAPPYGFPIEALDRLPAVGFGSVRTIDWDGVGVTQEVQDVTSTIAAGTELASRRNGFYTMLESNTANRPLMLVFMILLGTIIGPVNLFYFARRNRRARLIWTTPLISVIASVLLVILIFVQDGVGGAGERAVVALYLPHSNQRVLLQEQISRTGVLLSNRFGAADGLHVEPIHLDEGYGTRTFARSGDRYTGDFFRTRTVQAQRLVSVRSARARIELIGYDSGNPRVASSLPVEVDRLFYVDRDAGRIWTAENVKPGQQLTLAPDVSGAFADLVGPWSKGRVTPWVIDRLQRASDQKGWFFATTEDAGPVAIPTLPSLRWKATPGLLLGPVAGGAG